MRFSSVFLILFLYNVSAEKQRYDGFKVYRVKPPQTKDLSRKLFEMEDSGMQFWSGPFSVTGRASDVMLPPNNPAIFKTLNDSGLEFSEFIPDVQKLIDAEEVYEGERTSNFSWDKYYGLSHIFDFVDRLSVDYSDLVKVRTIGKSHEGREIKLVTVSKPSTKRKPSILMDANIHAREWITSAVLLYFCDQLVKNQSDATVKEMLDTFDFHFIPVLNPDGFVYTHEWERLWRKTRTPTTNPKCIGTDPNRNFDFHWMDGGASSDACSAIYAGPKPFSEPCTRALRDLMYELDEAERAPVVYCSLHSYSQLILLPYGHSDERWDGYEEHMRVSQLAIEEHSKPYGSKFIAGSTSEILYRASGSSMDFMKGFFQTKWTFTYELRDTGKYGFLLPSTLIHPSCVEFVLGFYKILSEVKNSLAVA